MENQIKEMVKKLHGIEKNFQDEKEKNILKETMTALNSLLWKDANTETPLCDESGKSKILWICDAWDRTGFAIYEDSNFLIGDPQWFVLGQAGEDSVRIDYWIEIPNLFDSTNLKALILNQKEEKLKTILLEALKLINDNLWISDQEKIPECSDEFGISKVVWIRDTEGRYGFGIYRDKADSSKSLNIGWYNPNNNNKVTHWMPIPVKR